MSIWTVDFYHRISSKSQKLYLIEWIDFSIFLRTKRCSTGLLLRSSFISSLSLRITTSHSICFLFSSVCRRSSCHRSRFSVVTSTTIHNSNGISRPKSSQRRSGNGFIVVSFFRIFLSRWTIISSNVHRFSNILVLTLTNVSLLMNIVVKCFNEFKRTQRYWNMLVILKRHANKPENCYSTLSFLPIFNCSM